MIDPGEIKLLPINHSEDSSLRIEHMPEYETESYDIYDPKDFEKYIRDVEKCVRNSFEYKQFIEYLHDYMDLNDCLFIKEATRSGESNVKIEIHHTPFTLYDIVNIVFNKRNYYKDSLDIPMVSKEVMMLHYLLVVGLCPLSKTAHELVHNGYLFVPLEAILGNWRRFMDMYKDFMEPEHKDVIKRIEKYNKEYDPFRNKQVLSPKQIDINVIPVEYQLPNLDSVYDGMVKRLDTIKKNNYLLPQLTQEDIDKRETNVKKLVCPVTFF